MFQNNSLLKKIQEDRLVERFGGWTLIAVICFIPVFRWATMIPLSARFDGMYLTLTSIGKLLGIVGFLLYAVNFVLSMRKRWLEYLFGGLNRVYIAHHITGGLALICILFHPLFLALRMIDVHKLSSFHDAAVFLLPRSMNLRDPWPMLKLDVAYNNALLGFFGLVVLLLLTFYAKLPYRLWHFTHKFLGAAFLFAGLHVVLIASDVSIDPFLKVYMWFWLIVALGAFIYHTLLGTFFIRRTQYRVVSTKMLPGETIGLVMEPVGRKLDFKEGQFIFIRFLNADPAGVGEEYHPFSVASAPNQDELWLCIKALGDFTSQVLNVPPGTIADIDGAYGKFSYRRFGSRPQVWIAGGIGITPFLSMARSYSEDSPPVTLIYSVVKREELLDQEALADYLPKYYPNFKYYSYVNEEQQGFLNAQAIQAMTGEIKDKEIFICGPPAMMKVLRAQLRALGVPNSRIHTEEFALTS